MQKSDRIFITNHTAIPGCSLVNRLSESGYDNLILKTPPELDLLDQAAVSHFFQKEKPDYVFLTSVRSGGIQANIDSPASFLYENLQAQNNVINASGLHGVKKLIFIASSCVYPRDCPQPMREEYLLTGPLEKTSEPYSIAKLAGIKLCEYYNRHCGFNFISAIPATVYGPDDDFDSKNAHVIPALIKKMHEAKIIKNRSVVIWGSGKARREFIYEKDMADAAIFLIENYSDAAPINIGVGSDIAVCELAKLIKEIVSFNGELTFDETKPEGAMNKLLDNARIKSLNWTAQTEFIAGLHNTYRRYLGSCVTQI